MKRTIAAILASMMLSSCMMTVYNRSTVSNTEQHATTEGTITNSPQGNSASVAAEKTTDIQTQSAVSTDSGKADASKKPDKKDADIKSPEVGSEAAPQAGAQGGADGGNAAVDDSRVGQTQDSVGKTQDERETNARED